MCKKEQRDEKLAAFSVDERVALGIIVVGGLILIESAVICDAPTLLYDLAMPLGGLDALKCGAGMPKEVLVVGSVAGVATIGAALYFVTNLFRER